MACAKPMHTVAAFYLIHFLCFLFTEITCTKTSLHVTHNVNVTNDKQSYDFNEEVTMSCNYGFTGNNVTTRCTDVNTWSNNTPTCTGKNVYYCNM